MEKKSENEEMLLEDVAEPKEEAVHRKETKRCFLPFIPKMYWFFYRKPIYLLIFIPSLSVGFMNLQTQMLTGKIIDALSTENPQPLIKKYALMTFISGLGSGVISFITHMLWIRIGARIGMKIKSVIFKSLMEQDVEFFDKKSIGELLVLLNEDAATVESVFSQTKTMQLRSIGLLCAATFVALSISWQLTILALTVVISCSMMLRKFRVYAQKHMKARAKVNSVAITICDEAVSNPRVVYSYGRSEFETNRFFEVAKEASNHERIQHANFRMAFEAGITLNQGVLAIIFSVGGFSIMKGKISTGELFTLIRTVIMFGFHISTLIGTYNREVRAMESCDRIWDLAEKEPSIDQQTGIEPSHFSGSVEFKNVWFKYPTRENWVLKNVSFKIEPGEITAFVGHSGSGKSTIVQLLMRFYDVNEGEILLDGRNIKDYSPSFLHRLVGVVQQMPSLFTLTVKENIIYGMVDASEEEIIKSATIANAISFIKKLPEGFDSAIGEKGSNLSGGQKQRVAIARAIIKNPKVLIADEATAALDAVSEKKVQEALDNVMQGRTSIIIAHRLGTIRQAKKIHVFDSGELVEAGTHEELIAKEGKYYDLVKLQLHK